MEDGMVLVKVSHSPPALHGSSPCVALLTEAILWPLLCRRTVLIGGRSVVHA